VSILLNAENLSMSFEAKTLFQDIGFSVHEGEKIGLIGSNAAGKSTLLKIIAKKIEPDSGRLVFRANTTVSTLDQDPQFQIGQSILEVLHQALPHEEAWQVQIKAEEMIWQLGLKNWQPDFNQDVESLSGGWKKRIALLRALLPNPDLLLLDEPTNHLDIEGILWLEEVIAKAKYACLTITHDRVFLQRVSKRILELDRRNPRGLLNVEGSYQDYLQTKEAMLIAQQGREASLRSVLRRETEWLKAGVKAQRSKQSARIQRHAVTTSELKDTASRNTETSISMEFQSAKEPPKRLIEAKRISKSFSADHKLFHDLDLFIGPGTRLGVIGENGCGKSTLLKVLLDEERPDSGHIFRSELLKAAFFEQNRGALDPTQSLLRSVCPYGDSVYFQGRQVHIRSYLDRFLFSQEQLDLPIAKLSGGEQSRVLIAKLMLIECNLLVLDEPTNDLDLMSLNVLQDCLNEFEGAVILVSHDRYFLDQVSETILAFPVDSKLKRRGELALFSSIAQWESWHRDQIQDSAVAAPQAKRTAPKEAPVSKPSSSQQVNQLTKKIEQLEKKAKRLEEECQQLNEAGKVSELISKGAELANLQTEIDRLYKDWEALA
jgi:ATP-binding cassette subfamily F protein uup